MPTKRGGGVGGGGPPTHRRQGRISRLPEGSLVNAAMVLLALTPALGLKVASSVSSSLTFDSEASLNSTQQVAQDLFKRVWMVCEEQKPQPRSAGEIAAGMASLEPSKCTDEFSFQELCCADFKKLDFKRSGLMGLDNAKYLTTAPKQAKKRDQGLHVSLQWDGLDGPGQIRCGIDASGVHQGGLHRGAVEG